MTKSLDVVKLVIDSIESNGVESANVIGKEIEIISNNIIKYSCGIDGVSYITAFLSGRKIKKLTFIFDNQLLSESELKRNFNSSSIGYNFRENYTEFKFMSEWEVIDKVFFIEENKFEVASGGFVETTPFGDKKIHSDIDFDCFCIRLK